MAVPKSKQSKSRTNKRFANYKATAATLVDCPHCHELKEAHKVCGRLSGRDLDKIEKTGLTPITLDGVMTLDEAKLVLKVRKLYEDVIKKEGFLEEALLKNYPTDDFHTVYVCEIEKVYIKD